MPKNIKKACLCNGCNDNLNSGHKSDGIGDVACAAHFAGMVTPVMSENRNRDEACPYRAAQRRLMAIKLIAEAREARKANGVTSTIAA